MKKRNITAIIIASSIMMLSLVGCGVTAESDDGVSKGSESEVSVGTESESPESTAAETPDEEEDFSSELVTYKPSNPTAADASFEYNGNTITYSKDDIEKIKSALGKPTLEDQAPSSDDPSDKLYTYGEFPNSIDLTEIGGKASTITIYDTSIKTSRGISIGSTYKDVIAAYGDAELSKLDGSNEIDYAFDNYVLIFFFDNNEKVKAILYREE